MQSSEQLPPTEQTPYTVYIGNKGRNFLKAWDSFIIVITGATALGEPWPSSQLFAILPYCRSVRLLLLWISEQFNFYSVRLSVLRPTPNLEDQGIPLLLAPTPRPVRPGWPYQ
jgi:hypothetical protein